MVSTQQAILLVFTFASITVTMARSTKLRSTYLDSGNSPQKVMATYARTDNDLNTWWNFGDLFPFDLFSRSKKTPAITTTTTKIPVLTTSVKVSTKIRTTRSTTDTQVPLRPMSSEYLLWRVTSPTKLPTSEAPTVHGNSIILNSRTSEATSANQASGTESDRVIIGSTASYSPPQTSSDEASIITSVETTTTTTKLPTTASTTKMPTTTASTTKMPTTMASTTKMPTTTASTSKMPTTMASTTKMPPTTASTTKMPPTTASTTKFPTTTASTTKMPTTTTTTKSSWPRRNRGNGRGNHRRSHRHRHLQRHNLHRLQRKIEKSRKRFMKRIRKLQRHFEKERQMNHIQELRELEAHHKVTMKKLMDIINQMVKQYPRRTRTQSEMEYADELSQHVYHMIDTNLNGRVEVNDIKRFLMLHGVFDQNYGPRTSKHLKPR